MRVFLGRNEKATALLNLPPPSRPLYNRIQVLVTSDSPARISSPSLSFTFCEGTSHRNSSDPPGNFLTSWWSNSPSPLRVGATLLPPSHLPLPLIQTMMHFLFYRDCSTARPKRTNYGIVVVRREETQKKHFQETTSKVVTRGEDGGKRVRREKWKKGESNRKREPRYWKSYYGDSAIISRKRFFS